MPTNKTRTLITLTPDELETLRREAAKKNISLNNYLRKKLGLKPLTHGATIGNKRNPHGRKGNREET